jgi:hypothetical protein
MKMKERGFSCIYAVLLVCLCGLFFHRLAWLLCDVHRCWCCDGRGGVYPRAGSG